jgi:hypothetical protein
MTIKLIPPLDLSKVYVAQSFDGHVDYAEQNGLCPKPAKGCTKYYYGGIDYAPNTLVWQ